MASKTVYLITGANRGIGLGMTATLLLRPNTSVIATVRSTTTNTSTLSALPSGENSNLITGVLSSTSDTDASALLATLPSSVSHIDVLVANAGFGASFLSALSTPLQALRADFEVNTLGPIKLFQTFYPLLSASKIGKFVVISSSLGSIAEMEGAAPSLSYGVSKAGVNYAIRKVHFECAGIVSLAVHPGWVKTDNGQLFADAIGFEAPPMTLEDSVNGVLKQIDGATREGTSGTFVSYDGSVIPW